MYNKYDFESQGGKINKQFLTFEMLLMNKRKNP